MRVVNRFAAATAAVLLAAAMAVPGCGSSDTETAADTESALAEPTPEPTLVPPEPEPDEPVDTEWMRAFNDVAVTADGQVYASAAVGIAALDELGEWTIVDLDGLPEGAGADEFLPGRLINNVTTGPDGQLWATGWAHSTIDDEAFGGMADGWTLSRDLSWIARHDCVADVCSWEVFTSDDTPELLITDGRSGWPADIGDVAIGADGTVYASVGENQLVVYDRSGWDAHAVPDLPTGWNGSVTPWSSSLAVGTDGLVWAGTNSGDTGRGLFMFDGAEFTHLTSADGLPDDNAFQVAVASDGTIWVATDALYTDPATASPDEAAGVASYDGTTWTTYTLADGLLSNDGIVAAGPDGTVWVVHGEVGQSGYARFDGTGWTAYPTDLPVGGFRAVVDSEGTLWSTAEDGLVRFDGTTKTVYESPFALDEQAVFSFADDDLCEWVSEEDVAEFVAAEFDWQGTAGNQGRPYPEAVCEWTLSGSAHSAVIAEDAGRWKDFDGNPYKISETEIVEYEGGTVNIGASVVGHPAVSDGVVVHNGGFGMFAFGVPPDSEWLGVQVHVDPEGVEWNAEHEARYFAVADHFVEELGWLAER